MDNPLDAVLSGEYELCISTETPGRAFIRNASFKNPDGTWTKTKTHEITTQQAEEIHSHDCVVRGFRGSIIHYHTRNFPVKPRESQ